MHAIKQTNAGPVIGAGISVTSRVRSTPLWTVDWRTQTPGAATLPAGMTLTRASTEWPRADDAGIAYVAAVPSDTGAIARVGTVVGLQIEGLYVNELGPQVRGSAMNAAPWTAGNVAPVLNAGAGADGTANAACRITLASGGYPTAYTRYRTTACTLSVAIIQGSHCKPAASNQSAQVRWTYSSVSLASGGDIPLGSWSRVESYGTPAATNYFFTPVESGGYAAQGGIAASAKDLLVDMAYRYAMPVARSPISWHDGTHAGTRASFPASDCLRRGRLDVEMDVCLPYAWTLLRWDARLWTLAGTTDTFAEIDQVSRRLRVSVHGMEVKFPVEITSSPTQAVSNTVTGCWIQGSEPTPGSYDPSNTYVGCTWYTTWSTTAEAQAVIDAAGR